MGPGWLLHVSTEQNKILFLPVRLHLTKFSLAWQLRADPASLKVELRLTGALRGAFFV